MALRVGLLPIADADRGALSDLTRDLSERGFSVEILAEQPVPGEAYDPRRHQYRAGMFLDLAQREAGDLVLAVTEVDLYSAHLNFVFGQAESPGRVGVISLYRLRAGADPQLFRERVVKEAFHELGHALGLSHCADPRCVMHFSNSLDDTDRKGSTPCRACQQSLFTRLAART